MAKAQELTQEEQDIINKFDGGQSTKEASNMSILLINVDDTDSTGKEVPAKTFHIKGTELYSKTITFRPLHFMNKLISMKQDGKTWKTTNESILYQMFEQPIDARGGIACGRLLGKAIPEHWNEEQKKANKAKANFYGFLFGIAQFPGADPVLVNFRVTGGKAKQFSDVFSNYKAKGLGGMRDFNLTLGLKPEKGTVHPKLVIVPDVERKLLSAGLGEHLKSVDEYIESHNTRIRASHQNAKIARKGLEEDTALGVTLDSFNDEIPY